MKQKSLFAFICLGLLTLYFACQKDDAITKEEGSTQNIVPKIETIFYDDGNAIFNDLKTKYNLDNSKNRNLQGIYTLEEQQQTLSV